MHAQTAAPPHDDGDAVGIQHPPALVGHGKRNPLQIQGTLKLLAELPCAVPLRFPLLQFLQPGTAMKIRGQFAQRGQDLRIAAGSVRRDFRPLANFDDPNRAPFDDDGTRQQQIRPGMAQPRRSGGLRCGDSDLGRAAHLRQEPFVLSRGRSAGRPPCFTPGGRHNHLETAGGIHRPNRPAYGRSSANRMVEQRRVERFFLAARLHECLDLVDQTLDLPPCFVVGRPVGD